MISDAMLEKFKFILDILSINSHRKHDGKYFDVSEILLNLSAYPQATGIAIDVTENDATCVSLNIIDRLSIRTDNRSGLWDKVIDHDIIILYGRDSITISHEESDMVLPIDHPLVTHTISKIRMLEL